MKLHEMWARVLAGIRSSRPRPGVPPEGSGPRTGEGPGTFCARCISVNTTPKVPVVVRPPRRGINFTWTN